MYNETTTIDRAAMPITKTTTPPPTTTTTMTATTTTSTSTNNLRHTYMLLTSALTDGHTDLRRPTYDYGHDDDCESDDDPYDFDDYDFDDCYYN